MSQPECPPVEQQEQEYLTEDEWMEKLKEVDKEFSEKNGLTIKAFNALVDQLYETISSRTPKTFGREYVIDCLKENVGCSILCSDEINKYITAINKTQLRKVKTTYENILKEEQEKLEEAKQQEAAKKEEGKTEEPKKEEAAPPPE